MSEKQSRRIERWEYDAGRDLLVALLDDDRDRYDKCVDVHAIDRPETLTGLIIIALRVAEVRRFRYYLVHRPPTAEAYAAFGDRMQNSRFADLFDRDLAERVTIALYQRPRTALTPPNDLISMTTCFALAGWRLWISRRGLFPLDRHARCRQTYSAIVAGMRLQDTRVVTRKQ